MSFLRTIHLIGLHILSFTLLCQTHTANAAFSDVPANTPREKAVATAVEYLHSQGIISGYADGTFKPNNKVNRAEAVKIIVSPLASKEKLATYTDSVFNDVATDAWYLPYVEHARSELGIVDGPPSRTSFEGGRSVLKAEFIKMLLLAHGEDPWSTNNDIKLALAHDVANPDDWFYPYMRMGISTSMTAADDNGNFSPGRELTRGDVALLMFRYLMHTQGRRTQALLNVAMIDTRKASDALKIENAREADLSSVRALVAIRGALDSQPDSTVVHGAHKIVQAFRSLVRGYKSGSAGDYAETIRLSKEAWQYAEDAKSISAEDLGDIPNQVQSIASSMASSAREKSGIVD